MENGGTISTSQILGSFPMRLKKEKSKLCFEGQRLPGIDVMISSWGTLAMVFDQLIDGFNTEDQQRAYHKEMAALVEQPIPTLTSKTTLLQIDRKADVSKKATEMRNIAVLRSGRQASFDYAPMKSWA